jgi:hypothetical protein
MANEPQIFEKNYVNSDDAITSPYGGFVANFYDTDRLTQWGTTGAASDTTMATVDIVFYDGTVATNRDIDTILLANHNFKDWKLQTWTGTTWTDTLTVTGDSGSTTLRSFSLVNTSKIRLSCTATQTPNQEKALAELVVTKLILTFPVAMAGYTVRPRQRAKTLTFGDGSMAQVITNYTSYKSQKYECNAQFTFVPVSTWSTLSLLKESGRQFLWYPEPDDDPSNMYQVAWTSSLGRKYSTLYKGAGLDISMDLIEL